MDQNQGIKTWQWAVTAIVVIIIIILAYYMFKGNGTATPETTGETPVTEETALNGINRVNVADQYPGNVVYVTSAQLENPGWVVVHEDNNGTPGAVIGSAYFDKGTNPGKITLSKSTTEGKLYYAMLHSDDGDKKFDSTKDLPVEDASGNEIMKTFRATTNVTEIKG